MDLFKNASVAAILFGALTGSGSASAASLSFFLDQSNAAPDGVPYLQVTIADGVDGAVDFTVQALDALGDAAGRNFGIQSFAFNVIPGGDAEGASVGNLPEGWITRDHYRMSEFGFFDVKLYGGGNSRLETLTFSILGIDGDTPEDYAVLSTGNVPDVHTFFSARVAGPNGTPAGAFIGGSTAVPLPAAGGLAVACVPWLYGYRRRRTRTKAPGSWVAERYGLMNRMADLSLFCALCGAEWLKRRFRHVAPANPGEDDGSAA